MCTALACPIIPVIRISMAYSSCRQNKPRSKATRPLKPTVNVHTIYHVHQCNITCVLLLTVNSHIRLSILRIVVTKTFAQGQPVEICSLNFLLLPLCFCYATLPPPPLQSSFNTHLLVTLSHYPQLCCLHLHLLSIMAALHDIACCHQGAALGDGLGYVTGERVCVSKQIISDYGVPFVPISDSKLFMAVPFELQ